MSPELPVVENDGMFGAGRRLQPRGHFAGMQRIASSVRISRYNHGCWICSSIADLVIWRIACERSEIGRIVYRAELILPHVSVVKKVIPEHVQDRNHTNGRPEEMWFLSQGNADQQSRI